MKKIAAFIFTIIAFSCSSGDEVMKEDKEMEDDCPETIHYGEALLAEDSDLFIPYSDATERVILSDSLGNEFTANVTRFKHRVGPVISWPPIECNSSRDVHEWEYDAEGIHVDFVIEELDIRLDVSLSASVREKKDLPSSIDTVGLDDLIYRDGLVFSSMKPINQGKISNLFIVANYRNYPDSPIIIKPFLKDVSIHGKQFSNVYYRDRELEDGQFKLYYSKEIGIVGLENSDKSISLKHERTE